MATGALILTIGLIVPASPSAQTLGRSQGERFAQSLLENRKPMDSWFDRGILEASRRLRIKYDGVENKYLISYGFGDSVRQMAAKDPSPIPCVWTHSATHREVPFHNGRYSFAILKSVFDEPTVPPR